MRLQTSGTWWVSSKSNPKWDKSGVTEVGGFVMPREAKEHVKNMKKKLGKPPKDLEWGYMKD